MTESYRPDIETERSMKDQFMAHHAESPFVAERIHDFAGLRYFPVDEDFRIIATLERNAAPAEAFLRTNRDGQAVMRYLGDLAFRLDGQSLRLRVYHAGEGVGTSVFVPFRDRTSGSESYAPGRYLTLELNEEDEYDLDFNRAFNPYCAYTDAYECPFPPVENDLPVSINAGEKAWAPGTPATATSSSAPARVARSSPTRRGTARASSGSRTPARKPARSRGSTASPARRSRRSK